MSEAYSRPEIVLFDLDGTLTDPGIGITNSAMYALEKLGLPVPDREALYQIIGPPLTETFEKIFGLQGEEIMRGIQLYREYYKDRGLYENEVYPGIPEALKKLRDAGVLLAVASSKPELYVEEIIRHFGLESCFTGIYGASMDETRNRKEEVILHALSKLQVEDRSKVLMVGDRNYDIFGARNCGIPALSVLYGYGSEEELKAAGAERICRTPEELPAYIL